MILEKKGLPLEFSKFSFTGKVAEKQDALGKVVRIAAANILDDETNTRPSNNNYIFYQSIILRNVLNFDMDFLPSGVDQLGINCIF